MFRGQQHCFDSNGFSLNKDIYFALNLAGKSLNNKIYYKFEDNVYDGTRYDINSATGKSKEPTSSYKT